VAGWYEGLTVLALAFAYRGRGLGRMPGAVIIADYSAFVAALLISVTQAGVCPAVAVFPAAAVMAADALLLMWPARWRPLGRTAGAGIRVPSRSRHHDDREAGGPGVGPAPAGRAAL
jgi:hypothetical protein